MVILFLLIKVKTSIVNDHKVWTPSKGSSFLINGHFKIPVSRVFYTPGYAEVLKNGWIQYLSYFILVFSIVYGSVWFFLHNQLISTFVVNQYDSKETTALKSLMY